MAQLFWLDSEENEKHFLAHLGRMRLAGKRPRVQFIDENYDPIKTHDEVVMPEEKPRTPTQNNCLHFWLEGVAEALNDAGYDMKKVLKADVDIPWTKQSAKDHLWKPIQAAMTGKESTTEATTIDYPVICDTLSRHLSQKLGIELPPWPTRFNEGGKE